MSELDRLADEEWKKRAPLRKVWTWKEGFIDGWNMHKKCGEEYHAVLELKLEEEKKKAEALVEALKSNEMWLNVAGEALSNPEHIRNAATDQWHRTVKALAPFKEVDRG